MLSAVWPGPAVDSAFPLPAQHLLGGEMNICFEADAWLRDVDVSQQANDGQWELGSQWFTAYKGESCVFCVSDVAQMPACPVGLSGEVFSELKLWICQLDIRS